MEQLINGLHFLLLAFILASVFYIFDKLYRDNKKQFIITLLFPPLIIIYVIKNLSKVKENIYYFLILTIVTAFVGFIVQKPFLQDTYNIIYKIFLWPIYLSLFLISKIKGSIYFI